MPILGVIDSQKSGHLTVDGLYFIASQTLGSNASSITFSSIPSTYTDLWYVGQLRTTNASAGVEGIYIQFNGDTANNYWNQYFIVTSAGSLSLGGLNQGGSGIVLGYASGTGNAPSTIEGSIQDYKNTNKYKEAIVHHGGTDINNASAQTQYRPFIWKSTSAINQITFTPFTSLFATGTQIHLFGYKGAK